MIFHRFSLLLFFLLTVASGVAQEPSQPADSSASLITTPVPDSSVYGLSIFSDALDETRRLIAEDILDHALIFPALQARDFGSFGQVSPLLHHGANPAATHIRFGAFDLGDPILGTSGAVAVPIHLLQNESVQQYDLDARTLPQIGGKVEVQPLSFHGDRPYSRVFFRTGDWAYSDLGVFFGLPVTKSATFMIAGDRQEYDGFAPNLGHTGSRILSAISYRPHAGFELNYSMFLFKNEVETPAPVLPDLFPFPANARRKENRWQHALTMRAGSFKQDDRQFYANLNVMRLKQETLGDSLLFDNRDLRIGLELEQKFAAGNHIFDFGGRVTVDRLRSDQLDNHSDFRGYGAFRYAYRPEARATVSGQIGIQKHDDFSADWVAAGHLKYTISSNNYLWLGAKRAVRYPTFAERYWQSAFYLGAPQLEAEKGYTGEIGFRLKSPRSLFLKTSLFIRRVENWIGEDFLAGFEDLFGPQNLDTRTVSGLDTKFIWTIFPALEFGFIGSYLNVAEDAAAKQVQIPEFRVYSYFEAGDLFFDDFVFIRLRLSSRIFGERHGLFFANSTNLPEQTTLDPDVVFDTKFSFEFSNAALYVSWENLFDRRYQLVPGFFMPPRTLRFGVDWEFLD